MEMVVQGQNQSEIAPKSIKFQEIVEEEEEDRISALPDCLILEILSRLPSTKGAIRTGALSKRWKYIWTSVSSLCFTDYIHPPSDFYSSVDKALNQCCHLNLKKLQVCICYDTQFESQVNIWILYAISRNVEELNLWLWSTNYKAELLLDQTFFSSSCFTDITLTGCISNPIGVISWNNLKNLCISNKKLDEDSVENILSGSPQLETLVLDHCYGYRRLNITSESVKNLVFSGYMIPEDVDDDDDDESDVDDNDLINIIEINAPDILSLTIKDDLMLWKLLLVNVSSLVKARLDYENVRYEITCKESEEEMLKGCILNLRHVKEFEIGDLCSEVLCRLETKAFVFPSNIKLPDMTAAFYPHTDLVERVDWSDGDSREIDRCSCFTMVLKLMRLID